MKRDLKINSLGKSVFIGNFFVDNSFLLTSFFVLTVFSEEKIYWKACYKNE